MISSLLKIFPNIVPRNKNPYLRVSYWTYFRERIYACYSDDGNTIQLSVSKRIFSHLHRIVIYQKNQFNLRLFHLSNQIPQINRPIRIRQAQIQKTAKK